MKIVEAISDTNIGGAGVVLVTRISASEKYKNNTVVIIPKSSEFKGVLIKENIEYIEIDGCNDRSFDLLAVPKYIKVLKKLSPDIVNCHGCLSCRIAAFMCRIPVRVYTRHCAYPVNIIYKFFPLRFIVGRVQELLSTHIIAVAEAAKENLIDMGISNDKISVIINGVKKLELKSDDEKTNIRRSLNIPEKAVVVGIFARLESCKGHEDLIKAEKYLLDKSDNFRFLIVGKGSRESYLRDLCKQYGVEDKTVFTGFTNNVADFFNITDINVNCSCGTETSSLALSEGMSLGIPCVASEYGGNTYMVKNGNNGFTYPVHDSDALAKRIFLLAFSKTLYKRMSENALKRYNEELNEKNMSRQTYFLYESLVDRLGNN